MPINKVEQRNFWWGPTAGGAAGALLLAGLGAAEELQCKTIRLKSVLAAAGGNGLMGLAAFGTASLLTTWYIRRKGTDRLNETGFFLETMAKTIPIQWAAASATAFLIVGTKLYLEHRTAKNGFSYAVHSTFNAVFKGPMIPLMLVLSALSIGGIIAVTKME
ncbi:MAG: hypothetical protein HYT76_05575 [Deltaproteobacteria bacterium]|nr:hypothetical protein [Deltaproteobacteria bacterium]